MELSSRIRSVTVFRQGALVVRSAELQVSEAEVVFKQLPLSLADDSIRVRWEGDGELPVVRDLQVGVEIPDWEPSGPLDEELQALKREGRKLADQQEQIQQSLKRWQQLTVLPRTHEEDTKLPESVLEGRLALLRLVAERSQQLREQNIELEAALKKNNRRQQHLEAKMQQRADTLTAKAGELRKTLTLRLAKQPDSAVTATVVLEYRVPGACWAPAYSLQLNAEQTSGVLSMRAVVCQNSEEDWDGIPLILSTAQPQQWAELPELHSLRIGRRQSSLQASGWRPPPIGAEALFQDYLHFMKGNDSVEEINSLAQRFSRKGKFSLDDEYTPQDEYEKLDDFWGGEAEAQSMDCLMQEVTDSNWDAAESESGSQHLDVDQRELRPVHLKKARRAAPNAIRAFDGSFPPSLSVGDTGEWVALEPGSAVQETHIHVAMLDYGSLRLPAASDPQRGKLKLISQTQMYVEILQQPIENADLYRLLRQAREKADDPQSTALPRGFSSLTWQDRFDYTYQTEGNVEVPSDCQYHSIPVLQQEVTIQPRFVTVPRESNHAFRFVELTNPLDAPLPKGPIDIHLGEEFLLTSTIEPTGPKAKLRLGLGVEESIKVARNTHFSEEAHGVVVGATHLKHTIEIEVMNYLPNTASIEVRERVPVSDDEAIAVTIDYAEPAWHEYQQDETAPLQGGYHWEATVASQQKALFKAGYTLRIPANQELVGGNRREGA